MKNVRTHRKLKTHKSEPALTTIIPADRFGDTPVFRPDLASTTPKDLDDESFLFKQLLRIARQSGIAEPLACSSSLTLLRTSRVVHQCLLRVLKPLGLSEGKFAALVTLYMLDPTPSNPADLAYHTEITRQAITGLLDTMAERGWISRKYRLSTDRRFSQISLTDKGREVTVFAIYRFLQFAAEISQGLNSPQHELLDKSCAHLRRQCSNLVP